MGFLHKQKSPSAANSTGVILLFYCRSSIIATRPRTIASGTDSQHTSQAANNMIIIFYRESNQTTYPIEPFLTFQITKATFLQKSTDPQDFICFLALMILLTIYISVNYYLCVVLILQENGRRNDISYGSSIFY